VTLRTAQGKLMALDLDRLPAPVRAVMFNQPMFTIPVHASGSGFDADSWAALPADAPCDLFCKLGIKSWRDGGSLRPIARGLPLRQSVSKLLAEPTSTQRKVAKAWLDTGTPLAAHLFAYVDFADISETRWLAGPREIRFLSACQRGRSAGALDFRPACCNRTSIKRSRSCRAGGSWESAGTGGFNVLRFNQSS